MSKKYLMNIKSAKKIAFSFLTGALVLCVLSQTGCGPTYPKEFLDEAVVQLCKEEYDIDVKVELAGSTIAVYLPIENLFDQNFGVPEETRDILNDVILSVSRVTLSTDAVINFYLVIAQDPRLPEIEIVIVRYLSDLKLFHFGQISRGEFANRALIERKYTPQAQKEKILKSIFGQLKVEESEELMDEFMAKDISTIGDIGYWNGKFFIKEIMLEEFLAVQIADRSARKIVMDEEMKGNFKLNSAQGKYVDVRRNPGFQIDLNISSYEEWSPFLEEEELFPAFLAVLDTAAATLKDYKFENYQFVDVSDKVSGTRIVLQKEELEDLKTGKLNLGDLLWRK